MMVVDSQLSLLLFLLIGAVLPILVDLATKRLATGRVKSSVLLALALVSGLLTEFVASLNGDRPFDWSTAGYGALTAFVGGVISFYGITSPFGISGRTGAIQAAVPGGLGTSVPRATVIETPRTDPLA